MELLYERPERRLFAGSEPIAESRFVGFRELRLAERSPSSTPSSKNNGLGDACDATSCVHNIYIGTGGGGNYAKLIFQFNWTHAVSESSSATSSRRAPTLTTRFFSTMAKRGTAPGRTCCTS